jgi:nuclear transport factor 2 (NTF2) superfamily protein
VTPVTYPAGCNCIAKGAKQKMNDPDTSEAFAKRYTAAWCSKDPANVAAFFAAEGSLKVNDGEPAVGTKAITEVARGFMTSFPDLELQMDALEPRGDRLLYRWTLIGTNSGPGGSGHKVHISGYENWQFGDDGLIAESLGHFDEVDYQRQLQHGS